MPRNCLSGVPVDWLLLFLLLLSDLSSAGDNTYVQDNTVVCFGRQARFNWKYKVKSSLGIVWSHNGEQIASSASLSFGPEVISSDQFKGRLTLNSKDPFSFTLKDATDVDNGTYECVFHFGGGKTEYLMGDLEVKDLVGDNSLVEKRKETDKCFNLSCKAKSPCTWIYPNGTTEESKTIRYCSEKAIGTITCVSDSEHGCKCVEYTILFWGKPKDTTNLTGLLVGVIIGGLIIVVLAVMIIPLYLRRRCKEPLTTELPQQDNEDQDEEEKENEATKL